MPPNQFPVERANAALGNRFTVERVIRAGGQGVVLKALRTTAPDGSVTRDEVALKYYFDPTQDQRVEREVRALQGFTHPNLANVVEHGTIQVDNVQIRYVAWDFIHGQALDTRLRDGPLPAKAVACIGRDVARAIEHIWTKRIVHRDVNPKNILLRVGDAEAVLIDLGIARHLDETPLTGPGLTWGTQGYLSPEQCRAEPNLTCHSDVFSLGVSLQEALSGIHPTRGDQRALIANPRHTSELAPRCPAGMADLIDLMLKQRAAFRPIPTALVKRFGEIAADL